MKMAEKNEFHLLGYGNAFDCVVRALKLSEAQASYFSKVSEKAETLPQRELERAVSEENPNAFVKERIRPIAIS